MITQHHLWSKAEATNIDARHAVPHAPMRFFQY